MLPQIIQGGLGVAISNWRLARAVSCTGQLGVVAGTGLSGILTRRLMDGDPDGLMRCALARFPVSEPVEALLERYYIPGGRKAGKAYYSLGMYTIHPPRTLDQLNVIAAFVEVSLAKEGHSGIIGINLLEKVQMPIQATLYGAMLAGVDYILMGAGVPLQVAAILDKLARHEPTSYRLDVHDALGEDDFRLHFDPEALFPGITARVGPLRRPAFLPIISAAVLGQALLKRSGGAVDGFIVEGPTAGGHNAPPRGPLTVNEWGEPLYGARDEVDLERMRALGVPFWLAGSYGSPKGLRSALDAGAAGIQVGTLFQPADESGLEAGLKERFKQMILDGSALVRTSSVASPTGYPFKTALIPGTITDQALYNARRRICDLGFLRTPCKQSDGTLIYRCSAEPVDDYVRKGGSEADVAGRMCLCNHLIATAGFPQRQHDGSLELPLVTSGYDLPGTAGLLRAGRGSYSAADVIHWLLSAPTVACQSAANGYPLG
ncbi:MAG: nitronate monooxygenase [Chloroflexi bacterium]|nr:nitronate monooxygenase [Chloroflexota bacterium]